MDTESSSSVLKKKLRTSDLLKRFLTSLCGFCSSD